MTSRLPATRRSNPLAEIKPRRPSSQRRHRATSSTWSPRCRDSRSQDWKPGRGRQDVTLGRKQQGAKMIRSICTNTDARDLVSTVPEHLRSRHRTVSGTRLRRRNPDHRLRLQASSVQAEGLPLHEQSPGTGEGQLHLGPRPEGTRRQRRTGDPLPVCLWGVPDDSTPPTPDLPVPPQEWCHNATHFLQEDCPLRLRLKRPVIQLSNETLLPWKSRPTTPPQCKASARPSLLNNADPAFKPSEVKGCVDMKLNFTRRIQSKEHEMQQRIRNLRTDLEKLRMDKLSAMAQHKRELESLELRSRREDERYWGEVSQLGRTCRQPQMAAS